MRSFNRLHGLEASFNRRTMFVESGSGPVQRSGIMQSRYRCIRVRTEYAEENLQKDHILILAGRDVVGIDGPDPMPDAIATISFYLEDRIGYAEIRVASDKIEEEIYLRDRAFGIIGKINERPEA